MKTPYSYLEVEQIDTQYDQQVPIKVIVENINRDFHNGKSVRTNSSIYYVIDRIYNDDEWYSKLEEKWLSNTN